MMVEEGAMFKDGECKTGSRNDVINAPRKRHLETECLVRCDK
jgi:hypothetical protein